MDGRNEEVHTAAWLIETIEAGTTMQAYFGVVPEGAPLPAVRFHAQAQSDTRGVGSARILTQIDWLIAIVKEGFSLASIVAQADALDNALNLAQGENAGVHIHTCTRIEPFTFLETDDSGVQYRHIGGVYRTIVQAK